jgi:hypothetical protein
LVAVCEQDARAQDRFAGALEDGHATFGAIRLEGSQRECTPMRLALGFPWISRSARRAGDGFVVMVPMTGLPLLPFWGCWMIGKKDTP